MTIEVRNAVPRPDAWLGVVRAEGLAVHHAPDGFEAALTALLARRRTPLTDEEEALRQAVRDLLRNGRYKPTGRGKPASEYLVRAAQQDGAFPRINAPVDVNNYISLAALLPVSLWDLDLAGADTFVFRLGHKEETYVFNAGGQEVGLEDLVVGCRVAGGVEAPIVNPVKDSLQTKTTDATTRVAACIYAPAAYPPKALEALCQTFAGWLAGCGDAVAVAHAVIPPGETRSV